MKLNEKTKDLLQAQGAIVSCEGKQVNMRLPARGLINFIHDKNLIKDLRETNRDLIENILFNDSRHDKEWTGGSASDLAKNFEQGIDLKNHVKALAKIESGELGQKIKALHDASATRRRLTTSDIDGDFIFARRFDDKPFVLSKKTQVTQKVIEVVVNLSVNGSASAESINDFAAFSWAIINLIESRGVQCRVLTKIESKGPDVNGDLIATCEAIIKEPGQYVSPSKLAACLSTVFMRKALFTSLVLACDLVNKNSYTGLGKAETDRTIAYENGKLTLSADVMRGATDQIVNELTKIFKG